MGIFPDWIQEIGYPIAYTHTISYVYVLLTPLAFLISLLCIDSTVQYSMYYSVSIVNTICKVCI